MRRRRDTTGTNPLPERLRRFDPTDWPGASEWKRHKAWTAALDGWAHAHGTTRESFEDDWVEYPHAVAFDPHGIDADEI